MAKSKSREARAHARWRTASVWVAILLAGSLLAVALAQGGYGGEGEQESAAAAETVGVSTGVFTAEQAERGAAIFSMNCAGCHGAQLQGGMGPRLNPIDESFHGVSLAAVYNFVSQNMPLNAPGSLEPQQYADVISFVLSQNGFPAGEAELPADAEQLEQFTIDAPPAE